MRVIGGRYRSRTLAAPTGTEVTRPTSDRARESLFNIISPTIPEANVLDLFAGSGALGIEALSRGAQFVIFVEQHPKALQALRANLKSLSIPQERFFVASCQVEEFLTIQGRTRLPHWHEAQFAASIELVLADPPYASPWYDGSIECLEKSGLCIPGTLAVLEMSSRQPARVLPCPPWQLIDQRAYGAARLEFWKRADETHGETDLNSQI